MTTTDLHSQFSELGHRIEELLARLPDAAPPASTPTDPLTDAEDAVVAFLDRLEAGDLDAALQYCDPTLTYRIPGRSAISGTHEGADAVTAALSTPTRTGTSELRTRLIDVIARGNTVISIHEITGHTDGVPMAVEFVLRFTTHDGRILRVDEYSGDQYAADDLFIEPGRDDLDHGDDFEEGPVDVHGAPAEESRRGWRRWLGRRRDNGA